MPRPRRLHRTRQEQDQARENQSDRTRAALQADDKSRASEGFDFGPAGPSLGAGPGGEVEEPQRYICECGATVEFNQESCTGCGKEFNWEGLSG